ncbi:MAG: cysteine desulfurase [Candidatus Omnitrophica bacterium]|nr:cysteine desulfurase [Candidatus Omnitrophota bacterium]
MEAYLDYNATTPLDPRVLEEMRPYLEGRYGNASSFHRKGQESRHAVELARERVAARLGVEPGDILFTSGGTEADNLAVRGTVMARLLQRRHLAVSAVEHQAVLHTAAHLEKRGCRVSYVPVDSQGIVRLDELTKAVSEETAVVSLMHANNETGAIQPVGEAARIAHAKGALLHVDAVQSFGKLPVDPEAIGADFVAVSAHKICGPKGAGALYIRKGVKLESLLHGGHQEKNIRPGTENVAGIVGLGKAAELLGEPEREEERTRVLRLRERLEEGIRKAVPDVRLNGPVSGRARNTLNLAFPGLDGETLLMNLDFKNIYVSTGSACTAGSVEPSHVLLAMGLSEKLARAAIRFSLGRFTTEEEIEYALREIPPIIERLRKAATEDKK